MASSTSLQVAGLASNFDWKSFTDQVMALEHAPADKLTAEKGTNEQKSNMFDILGTKLGALQNAVTALHADGAFGGRLATSATSGSSWLPSAAVDTAPGTYQLAVTKLAASARITGQSDIAAALNPVSDDVSGLTISNAPLGTPISAGTFTVNGKQVAVAATDSLATVFAAINSVTGGDVTATYDHTTDKITFASASGNVTLGAANDTSNILRALKLANNGTSSTTSSATLGAVRTSATLGNANLGTAFSAVGSSSFKINGVSIAYNTATDTIASVMKRISDSSAGVTATYDAANDRFSLANTGTGDLGISATDDAGGLLASLGLTTGATFTRGQNAEYSVNGGPTLWSASNTLDASSHGITGLSVTVNSMDSQTIKVAVDSDSMQTKIQTFMDKYNDVQDYLDTSTKITSDGKGKVTSALLSSNREIQAWSSKLRSLAFGSISGLGSVSRLDDLGLDFTSGTDKLQIKDSAKLTAALTNKPGDVEAFFHTDTTGFAAQLSSYVTSITKQNTDAQANITKTNADIDDQIATIERRLAQDRSVMEASFVAMESAQSNLKNQQATLTAAFK